MRLGGPSTLIIGCTLLTACTAARPPIVLTDSGMSERSEAPSPVRTGVGGQSHNSLSPASLPNSPAPGPQPAHTSWPITFVRCTDRFPWGPKTYDFVAVEIDSKHR